MNTETTIKTPEEFAESCGLSYAAKFIPHSASRNKDSEHQQLNWKITLSKGVVPLIVDYSQGIGHLPWFEHNNRLIRYAQAVTEAVEGGKWFKSKMHHDSVSRTGSLFGRQIKPLEPPKLHDVLYSLVVDSDVLNYLGFEDWADNYGYDTDSIKANNIYSSCIDTALHLKNMIDLEEAQLVFQDY